jgi:hypothetical protein
MISGPVTKPAHIWIDRHEITYEKDHSSFDRLAFAMQALRLVTPPTMTVAVFEGCKSLRMMRGRDLRAGHRASWALLCVPPHASRIELALAVASVVGKTDDPYVLELILHHTPC